MRRNPGAKARIMQRIPGTEPSGVSVTERSGVSGAERSQWSQCNGAERSQCNESAEPSVASERSE